MILEGTILGSIEHPQNCFLKSWDVDYAGGKDMSFIEDSANPNQGIALPPDIAGPKYNRYQDIILMVSL